MNVASSPEPPRQSVRARILLLVLLGGALVWSAIIRAPLILNAPIHLDSDLSVDGLTLQEVVQGHWRWHYPGTPYMGTGPILLSLIQAKVWGANPMTLVSGGTAAYLLFVGTMFVLAWHGFGPRIAAWSLVPLTFASTGTLWLSSRITGGHLLIVAWTAAAWAILHAVLSRGGWRRLALLGLWCGLGLYLDSMFLMTLAGLVPAGMLGVFARLRNGSQSPEHESHWMRALVGGLAGLLIVSVAFLAGFAPRILGQRLEPHDAYAEQFTWTLDPRVVGEHARILALECLPRLIAGHRLPGLQADPDPALLGSAGPVSSGSLRKSDWTGWVTLGHTILALGLFSGSLVALGIASIRSPDRPQRAIAGGVLLSSLSIGVGFLVNRNIFNSDNYRYLVLLLVPWTLGFGLLASWMAEQSRFGRGLAIALALCVALGFTLDAGAWYRRFGWIDAQLQPVRRSVDEPALRWLDTHPEVSSLYGGYWDVYRLSFLTGGRVKGVPFPVFPNRFPEWSKELPCGRPTTMLVRPSPEGHHFLTLALRDGGKVLYRDRSLSIVSWPCSRPEF